MIFSGWMKRERVARDDLKVKMTKLMSRDEISWKQKFREKLLKQDNCNIKYFHALASCRRCNFLDGL